MLVSPNDAVACSLTLRQASNFWLNFERLFTFDGCFFGGLQFIKFCTVSSFRIHQSPLAGKGSICWNNLVAEFWWLSSLVRKMSSVILHSKNQILEPKNFYSEVRCGKDVANFLEDGLVLLDQTENDLDKLLLSIIRKVNDSFLLCHGSCLWRVEVSVFQILKAIIIARSSSSSVFLSARKPEHQHWPFERVTNRSNWFADARAKGEREGVRRSPGECGAIIQR